MPTDELADVDPRRRAAVFTIVRDEPVFLPIWLRYYGATFAPEDTFVLLNHEMEYQSRALVRLCCDAHDGRTRGHTTPTRVVHADLPQPPLPPHPTVLPTCLHRLGRSRARARCLPPCAPS